MFGRKRPEKGNGLSLIVNQIDKRARAKWPRILIVAAVVLTFLVGSFALTRAADWVDRDEIPERDEQVARGENLADYILRYVLVWDGVNDGGGYGMLVTIRERSHDLQLVKKTTNTNDPGGDLYIGVQSNSCRDGGYEFPASFTVYYPNQKQSPTRNLPYCLGKNERAQLTYTAFTGQHGYGAYEVRGMILDGEVVGCGFLQKCWKYHEHAFAYRFNVEKQGLWN